MLASTLMMAKSLGLNTVKRKGQCQTISHSEWRTCILDGDIQQDHMCEFNRMHWHHAPFAEVTLPVLVSVFVVDPVLDVVRQKILEFNGSSQAQIDLGEFPVPRL